MIDVTVENYGGFGKMETGYLRNKQILALVTYKLMSNNISFKFGNNSIDVPTYFKLSFYNTEVRIVTNTYHKDFNFLNEVNEGFILDIIDRIIFKY